MIIFFEAFRITFTIYMVDKYWTKSDYFYGNGVSGLYADKYKGENYSVLALGGLFVDASWESGASLKR